MLEQDVRPVDRKRTGGGLKGAEQRTRDRLEFDAGFARDRATAAALRLSDKVAAAGGRASSHWQEVRDKWATHVASVRGHLREEKGQLDADVAAGDANMAEDYALDAIDFATAAIDEAESAVLGACMRAPTPMRSAPCQVNKADPPALVDVLYVPYRASSTVSHPIRWIR